MHMHICIHTRGRYKQIEQRKLEWNVESKVGSLDNAAHKAGGGTKNVWSSYHGNGMFMDT